MVDGALNAFNKYQKPFINAVRQVKKTEEMLNASSMLGGDRELAFSIILQNMMQPKNANRTEAIKGGSYKELVNQEQGRVLIIDLLSSNLNNELKSAESECKNKIASLQQMQDVKLVLEAPDVFMAASVLVQ